MSPLGRKFVQFVHQHGDLDHLDISKVWVPMNVRVGDHQSVLRFLVLQQRNHRDIVLGHDAIKDVVCLSEIRSLKCKVIELDKMLIYQREPRQVEKNK